MSRPRTALQLPLAALAASVICLCLLGGQCAGARSDSRSEVDAHSESDVTNAAVAGPTDRPITAANVIEHEKNWPGIVALTREWLPPDQAKPLQARAQGVLVRVNPDGDPRIDFGRHGKYDVPIDSTDLVDRANAVRAGREFKGQPNFLRQVGTRLVDSKSQPLRAVPSARVAESAAYLCIFADPDDERFPLIAQRLKEGIEDPGILPILFPQSVGREDLEAVRDRLATLEWQVPFSYPHLSQDYTQALLGADAALPSLLLVSPEGRILYRASLDDDLDPAAIERAARL